jgi:hypothetical protein
VGRAFMEFIVSWIEPCGGNHAKTGPGRVGEVAGPIGRHADPEAALGRLERADVQIGRGRGERPRFERLGTVLEALLP